MHSLPWKLRCALHWSVLQEISMACHLFSSVSEVEIPGLTYLLRFLILDTATVHDSDAVAVRYTVMCIGFATPSLHYLAR
jgi:hypothetical protein